MRIGMTTILVLALAAGCGGGGGGAAEGGEETAGGEATYGGPLRSSDVVLGQAKYESRCASCHESGAPTLTNIHWTVERMRRQIREGSGQMAPIPAHRLSDDEMEAVIAYLQTIGGVDGDAATPEPQPVAE